VFRACAGSYPPPIRRLFTTQADLRRFAGSAVDPRLGGSAWTGRNFRGPGAMASRRRPAPRNTVGLLFTGARRERQMEDPYSFSRLVHSVVLGGQVWLTTGHAGWPRLLCDRRGCRGRVRIRFNEKAVSRRQSRSTRNDVNGYDSPSPAIELGRVYVHLAATGQPVSTLRTARLSGNAATSLAVTPGSRVRRRFLYDDCSCSRSTGGRPYVTALDKKPARPSGKPTGRRRGKTLTRRVSPNGKGISARHSRRR